MEKLSFRGWFAVLLAGVFLAGGCMTAELKYLSRIGNNIPPPPPDVRTLTQKAGSPEEALTAYRDHVIIPYKLEDSGLWVYGVGGSTTTYTASAMKSHLGTTTGKRAGGYVLAVPGALMVGVASGAAAVVPAASALLWPGIWFFYGGMSLVESANNDLYRSAIKYNASMAATLGQPGGDLTAAKSVDPRHPSAILLEIDYEDRLANTSLAAFLDAISPVGGVGCFYVRRYAAGVLTVLGSGAAAGLAYYGYQEDSIGFLVGGVLSYFAFRIVGMSAALTGARKHNKEIRQEMRLPSKPPDMNEAQLGSEPPRRSGYGFAYTYSF